MKDPMTTTTTSNGKGGYTPSIPLTRLYEKTSKNGNVYLVGRLGGTRITVLKSREVADDGGAVWNVLLQEAPQSKAASAAPEQRDGYGTARDSGEPQRRRQTAEPDTSARGEGQRGRLDGPVPF
jgi:hypothetical protein